MKTETLYILFNNSYVIIRSNATEVIAGIKCNFQEMSSYEPKGDMTAQLEVHKKNGAYTLFENNAVKLKTQLMPEALRHLRDSVVLHLIQSHPDLLWLHAGAVSYQDQALLVSAPSGYGKSTLVTSLYKCGWTYLSDDVIPFEPKTGKLYPFPETPMFRENPGREIPSKSVGWLKKKKVPLTSKGVCRKALPIAAIIFPTFAFRQTTRLEVSSPGAATLELLQHTLNFGSHREAAVQHLCKLIKQTPVFRLYYDTGNNAAHLLTQVFEDSISHPDPVTVFQSDYYVTTPSNL